MDFAMKLTRRGAVILADNMLWSGATFLPGVGREGARGLIEYTRQVFGDPRLSSLLVPLGDGIAISFRVK